MTVGIAVGAGHGVLLGESFASGDGESLFRIAIASLSRGPGRECPSLSGSPGRGCPFGGYPCPAQPGGDAAKPARTALSDGFPRSKGCFGIPHAGEARRLPGATRRGTIIRHPVGWSISRIGRIAGGAMALPRWFADGAQRLGGGAWQGWVWPWIAGVLLRPSCGCRD